ncbi:nitroreductase family protein [Halomonas salipaludis]|uniref:NAD(P)H-dependent oxidoreductase n=1 Tax=Halomonas salipaludis TaxID=2032625 RepID=A0A2A2ET00_9GAMM|nr:nitroreductase family protein [Halomonas salipaludis]PAU75492.1 NAD(P)H-dependent oxidoreductase [Halomonas salipaludis]
MNLIDALNWRYATKRMNGKQVPQAQLDRILEAVRLAPSSYGLQPYSVLVIEDRALRERISPVAFGQPQITESSHLLVFAAWEPVEEAHVDDLIELTAETRDLPAEALTAYAGAIKETVNGFASDQDKFQWAAKQAYLALGTALAAAAMEGIDASPMEGFDPAALDDLLGLREQNLRSVALMALGYRDSEADRYADLAKVRWPREKLFIQMPPA